MIKQINFRTDTSAGTAKLLLTIPAKGVWDCNILEVMLSIGVLTSPPRYTGFHLSTFWAWLRYGSAISSAHSSIRLKRTWSDIDPHQKTILSDDFGMGFTCQYLAENHGFDIFIDTNFLLNSLFGKAKPYKTVKNGKAKSPDFIALDHLNDLHILECKGSQSSKKSLKDAMYKGVTQKSNVLGTYKSCMVGGIYVPLHDAKENAEMVFLDPEPDKRLAELFDLKRDIVVKAMHRIYLSKLLMAAGMWRTATAIYDLDVNQKDFDFITKDTGELQFSGFVRVEDSYRKNIEYRSYEQIEGLNNDRETPMLTTLRIELQKDFVLFITNLFKQEKSTLSKTLDNWIETKLELSQKTFKTSRDKNNRDSSMATLLSPYGISFTLTRESYD